MTAVAALLAVANEQPYTGNRILGAGLLIAIAIYAAYHIATENRSHR